MEVTAGAWRVTTHLLLIECPDRKGLVHLITGVLYRRDYSIITNHEFVDPATEHFFMRTEFCGEQEPLTVVSELRDVLPPEATIRLATTGKRPIVIMATKEPHCLGDLLLRHAYDELPARITAVLSNYDTLAPLVGQFGIPFRHVSHQGCDRDGHEAALLRELENADPAYIVLAKYMRVLTPRFVARFRHRIINIHHSFLPAFVGASPYRQSFERGVKIIGATAHIVTDELDTGPIIAQGVLPVDHTYTADGMAQAGRDIEKIVLAKALNLVLEERIFLHHNRTIIFE
jgi:formyltetrahydrofolate deformylase